MNGTTKNSMQNNKQKKSKQNAAQDNTAGLSVVTTQSASLDIKSIAAYLSIELKSPKAAKKWLAKLDNTLEILRMQPEIGRIMEFKEREDPFKIRTFLVDQYRIFYTFDEDTLTVQRVLHTKRNIPTFDIVGLD